MRKHQAQNREKTKYIFFLLLAFAPDLTALGAEGKRRQQSIHFEEGVIEGVTDSKGEMGALITKQTDEKKTHIYDRMLDFQAERKEFIREFWYLP